MAKAISLKYNPKSLLDVAVCVCDSQDSFNRWLFLYNFSVGTKGRLKFTMDSKEVVYANNEKQVERYKMEWTALWNRKIRIHSMNYGIMAYMERRKCTHNQMNRN